MTEMLGQKQRWLWLDYARFAGIFFVVLAHTIDQVLGNDLLSWICSFTMQLFFFISGYLTSEKDSVKDTITKGLKGIMIPYLTFHLIIIAFHFGIQFIFDPNFYENNYGEQFVRSLLGVLIGEGMPTSFSDNLNVPLWFLPCLFVSKVVMQMLIKNKKRLVFNLSTAFIVCVIATYFLSHYQINIYFCIDSAIMGFPIYILGYAFRKYDKDREYSIPFLWSVGLTCLVVGFFLCFANKTGFQRVDMNSLNYGNNIFLFYINSVIGVMAIIFLSRLLSGKYIWFFAYIGANTLVVLGIHLTLKIYIKKLLEGIIKPAHPFYINNFHFEDLLICLTILVLCLPAIHIMNKYTPFLLGKFKQ